MSQTEKPSPIQSRVIRTKLVDWRSLSPLQHDEFKELPATARSKLKQSILSNEFAQPFYVWEDPEHGVIYCLDGKHRIDILEELSEVNAVPDRLPATFIRCANKAEAAKLVLIYSSIYAKITESGLAEFIANYQLDIDAVMGGVDLPGLKLPKLDDIEHDPFADEGIGVRNQFGVIVYCNDEKQQEVTFNKLTELGFNCKVVVT